MSSRLFRRLQASPFSGSILQHLKVLHLPVCVCFLHLAAGSPSSSSILQHLKVLHLRVLICFVAFEPRYLLVSKLLEIVFTIAAPAFDILFIGCVLITKIAYTTDEKLTF